MCRGCFIIVKTQRSGSPPRVAFYVFNPALTYWSCFRLRTNLFCKDSIREGTIFIPGRVGSLLYFIAIDLIQNGGRRLDHMMKGAFFPPFLIASVRVQLNLSCVCLEPACGIPTGVGWGSRPSILNTEPVFPPFCHFAGSRRRIESVTREAVALIAGQLLLMICLFPTLLGRNMATIWNKM